MIVEEARYAISVMAIICKASFDCKLESKKRRFDAVR